MKEDSYDRSESYFNRRMPESQGETGSVTIYFIAVTAAFVLLTALLIDFARMAAFRQQAELSVKSGVRSTLSSFDPIIYARYGLFIRGGESAGLLFRKTVEGHSSPQAGGVFPLIDTRWEETNVTESRPLANHDIFRRQILEEMKYKAPIDLSLETAERFRGLSGAMKEATATVDLLEKMRKAYERRESAMDEALAIQKETGEVIRQLLNGVVPYPSQALQNHSAGVVNNIADAASKYEDYVSKRQEDEARREAQRREEEEKKAKEKDEAQNEEPIGAGKSEGPIHGLLIAEYESGIQSLAARLSEASIKVRLKSNEAREKASTVLQAAKEANDQMRTLVEQAKSMPSSSMGEESTSPGLAMDTERLQSLEELRQTAEDMVFNFPFFEEYDAEIRLQHNRGLQLAEESASFMALAAIATGSTGRGLALRDGAERLQGAYSVTVQAYGLKGSVSSQREKLLQSHRTYDNEIKKQEQEAKTAWSGATNFLGGLTGVSGSTEEKAQFVQVTSLYHDNKDWNQAEEDHAEADKEQVQKELRNDPFEGRDEAMSGSSSIMSALQDSILASRDQLYFSEYTIGRFSHYDPLLVKEMLQGGNASLSIDKQETEYILYGLNNPSSNIAAAYGEIFAFRLAIRTMEGLVESRAMGHPLLVLAAALVYGIRNAQIDINLLVTKGKVQLSKYIRVDTTYTDYIRLFLLVHGGSANHMARTIAVMERASGLSFRGAYTYASAEGTASVKLWFFPGLLKVMGRYGDLGGTVKGSRYEATYTADSSYQ
ncbi:hypothetical protein [Cohnella sp.]|uniref:hypothetical protein n=1 Tax=Cohnella sp. TaxID=1883426 RepID=UPI003565AA84